MAQQKQIQKKKKKSSNIHLLMSYESLSEEEILNDLDSIKKKLIQFFSHHIGQENSTDSKAVFEAIYGINPEFIDIFKRAYWWNVLKAVLRDLKHNDRLFVINRGSMLFVLKTKQEANNYKDLTDKHIEQLKINKKKADEWVRKKKYLKLK